MSEIAPAKTTALLDPHMGVGAIQSRVPTPQDLGHMWLYWETHPRQQHREYRGYYPLINRIPVAFRAISRWREFFFDNSSPGARFRDLSAIKTEEHLRAFCKHKTWSLGVQNLSRLERRCWIPRRAAFVEEGHYSFDTNRPNCNNCASWAIRVTNDIMEDPTFLPLPQPARIKTVIAGIWGDDPR